VFSNGLLALLLVDRGRADEAEPCFRAALETEPALAEAAHSLALLLADTRPEQALAFCRQAAALRPDEPRYAYSLARLLRRNEDLTGAAGILRRLLEQSPGHEQARRLLADVEAEIAQQSSKPGSPSQRP
jgi:tetratricopeptide (TPR) repeat protein